MKIMPWTPCQKARIGYWKAYKKLVEFRREYADYECLCYMPWRHELRSAPLTGKKYHLGELALAAKHAHLILDAWEKRQILRKGSRQED